MCRTHVFSSTSFRMIPSRWAIVLFRILVSVSLLWPEYSKALSCIGWTTFLDAAKRSETIAHVRVVDYGDHQGGRPASMMVEVLNPIRGARLREKIRIRENPFDAVVSAFPIGTEWIFVFPDTRTKSLATTDKSGLRDLSIGYCGTFWAQVRGSRIVGGLRDMDRESEMSLDTFIRTHGPNP